MALMTAHAFSDDSTRQPKVQLDRGRGIGLASMKSSAGRCDETARKRTASLESSHMDQGVDKKRMKKDAASKEATEELQIPWDVGSISTPSPPSSSTGSEGEEAETTESELRHRFHEEETMENFLREARERLGTTRSRRAESDAKDGRREGGGTGDDSRRESKREGGATGDEKENTDLVQQTKREGGATGDEKENTDLVQQTNEAPAPNRGSRSSHGSQSESDSSARSSDRRSSGSPRGEVRKKLLAPTTFNDKFVDVRPYVCKSFATTGSCARGNTCIFAHDRSRFFEHEVEKARNRDEKRRREREKIDDELFDECPVCKKDFVEPVMTGCGHQFCLECISSDFDQCPVCGVEIRGDFTPVEDGAHQEDVRETDVQREKIREFHEEILDEYAEN